jgi:hypothetical protein
MIGGISAYFVLEDAGRAELPIGFSPLFVEVCEMTEAPSASGIGFGGFIAAVFFRGGSDLNANPDRVLEAGASSHRRASAELE